MTKAQEKAAQVLASRQAAYCKKVRGLLGHIARRLSERDMLLAFSDKVTAEEYAARIASRDPVGAAVHPVKAEAVQHAAEKAQATIERVRTEMEGGDWDIQAVAPYPERNMPHWERDVAKAKHDLFHALTTVDKAKGYQSYGRGPYFVTMADTERLERFVQQARDGAAAQYDAFICKLVVKVGDGVKAATLSGSHVWGHSILTVERTDGTTQRWKTQQIVNWSVLGNAYYQWPTRLLKGGAA